MLLPLWTPYIGDFNVGPQKWHELADDRAHGNGKRGQLDDESNGLVQVGHTPRIVRHELVDE